MPQFENVDRMASVYRRGWCFDVMTGVAAKDFNAAPLPDKLQLCVAQCVGNVWTGIRSLPSTSVLIFSFPSPGFMKNFLKGVLNAVATAVDVGHVLVRGAGCPPPAAAAGRFRVLATCRARTR